MLNRFLANFNRRHHMRASWAVLTLLGLATRVSAQQVSPELLRVDSLIAAREVAAAVAIIDAEARRAPREFEVLWRQSRLRVLQGDALPAQSREQDRMYKQALQIAEAAIRANGAAPDGYLRRAAAAGKVALFAGVLDAADFVLQAKEDAERVIAMTGVPPATLASAYYILGRTHLKLTETPRPLRMPIGLGFGNLDEALSNLRRARQLRPGFIMFELELGRALIAADQSEQARPILTAVANLPESEPGDATRKREAADALRSLR
jgi:tetratricopeptide (TPR) repeat protein